MRATRSPLKDSRGMKDPAHSVVGGLGGREGLMTALVREDPNSRRDETRSEVVRSPAEESRGFIHCGMREVQVLYTAMLFFTR